MPKQIDVLLNSNENQYFERSIGPVTNPTNSGGQCIPFPPTDKQRIKVVAPEKGKYVIKGTGTYCGVDYCEVDVLLQIKTSKGQVSDQKVIYADYNWPVKVINGKIVCEMTLAKGEEVYLTYGNKVLVRPEAGGFQYGFPGDSLLLIQKH